MICSWCGADNPEANRYCGQCGTTIDAASVKLQSQITAIVQANFKDQQLVADALSYRITQNVEARLMLGGKILALALAILVISTGLWGWRTYEGIEGKLNAIAGSAIRNVTDTGTDLTKKLNTTAGNLLGQMQNEAQSTESGLQSIGRQTKSTQADLQAADRAVQAYRARFLKLEQVWNQNPETPIGTINSSVFTPIYAPGVLTSPTQPTLSSTHDSYQAGSTGFYVTEIQTRLGELGCYSGTPTGFFDQGTTDAVIGFKAAMAKQRQTAPLTQPLSNLNIVTGVNLGSIDTSALVSVRYVFTPDRGPSEDDSDPKSGVVDKTTWEELGSENAAHCN